VTAIHHFSAGSLCPLGRRIVTGEPGLGPARLVCHCLLVEAGDSLVLVDTGMGTEDLRHPYRRLGRPFTAAFRVQRDQAETAIEQVRSLGHDPADVRHVLATHLDLDHAGGLPDFPDAEIHVRTPELEAALNPSLRERLRYPQCHFEHGPSWVEHGNGGDSWFGFESIRVLEGVEPEILLIPLPGHSAGHSAVALRDGTGWVLHCGDAYFHHREVEDPHGCPVGLRIFQAAMASDARARRANQERLRELARDHGDEVRLFCAHSEVELDRERSAAGSSG
jgi:glyoxylase-like metal-dependent hydrolase (beta-lactamase superfamily II)